MITGLLRGRFGFDGVVCTDWALVSDVPMPDGSVWEAKAWGVEELETADRLCRIIEAGCDQLGGEHLPELLVQLVEEGRVSEARIDESARRILRDKFRLGLFDDPYVDADGGGRRSAVARSSGRPAPKHNAERSSCSSNDGVLPLRSGARLFVDGLPAEAAAAYGSVVEHPADADAAIVFRHAPVRAAPGHVHRVALPCRQPRVPDRRARPHRSRSRAQFRRSSSCTSTARRS